jgi:hypothetical protein
MPHQKYLSVTEAAALYKKADGTIGCNVAHIRALCGNNEIAGAIKIGKQWAIPAAWIEKQNHVRRKSNVIFS